MDKTFRAGLGWAGLDGESINNDVGLIFDLKHRLRLLAKSKQYRVLREC